MLKILVLFLPALVWTVCLSSPVAAAQDDATRSSAIGQRAAAAIHERDAEAEMRQHLPIMAMERHSETAIANNRHNLEVIDNVVGKALEIVCLAFGVALIVSSVVEQSGKKEELARIAVGAGFVLFGLFCPMGVHTICQLVAGALFH